MDSQLGIVVKLRMSHASHYHFAMLSDNWLPLGTMLTAKGFHHELASN